MKASVQSLLLYFAGRAGGGVPGEQPAEAALRGAQATKPPERMAVCPAAILIMMGTNCIPNPGFIFSL